LSGSQVKVGARGTGVALGEQGTFPRAKSTLYDLGTNVSLAVRWGAKVPANRVIDDFISLSDLAPTFLEAAGLTPPDSMTGRSFHGRDQHDPGQLGMGLSDP
jgi:arylsulfatase A-like enzyme